MLKQTFLQLLITLFVGIQLSYAKNCNQRRFNITLGLSNSFVCVCNSTSCDEIESVDGSDKSTFYQEFITSRQQFRLDKFKKKFDTTGFSNSSINLTIKRSVKRQAIKGFGGAITDSAGYNIYSLSPNTVARLVESYFGDTGIQYNVVRVPVGGVDFSLREYTYDDTPNDFNLTRFALSKEDLLWKIPFVQAAKKTSKKELKLFASAWTAPPWMKTNNDYRGNGTLIGEIGGIYYQTWANYYLKFFQAYQQHGLNFWGMTAQNEPSDGEIDKFSFNCMGFTPESQAAFVVKNLGPTLEQNGFGNISIMIMDDQRLFLTSWPQRVFAFSPDAKKYVAGVAVHWYMDMLIPPSVLDQAQADLPDGKWIFGTEACSGTIPFLPHVILGGFDRAEEYAKYIIQDLNHYVTGWTDWNLALDARGGPNWANNFVDSAIIVNATADEFYKQPIYYAMGHFSKFIPENSRHIQIETSGSENPQLSYVAFDDDQNRQTVLVILNVDNQDLTYSIHDPDSNVYINSIITSHTIKTIVWYY